MLFSYEVVEASNDSEFWGRFLSVCIVLVMITGLFFYSRSRMPLMYILWQW